MPPSTGPGPAVTEAALSGGHRGRNIAIAAGSFVAVLALVAAGFLVFGGTKDAHAIEVTLQPLDDRGPGPFTASTVSVKPAVARTFARHHTGPTSRPAQKIASDQGSSRSEFLTRSIAGNTAAFYGVDPNAPVCNSQRLISLIAAEPATAKAWADTMGIPPSAIASTINGFTPVLLGADTAVTNHAYGSSGVTAFQGVLEAGTAVLIDAQGTPRLQCICGNPLAKPNVTTSNVNVKGTRWDGFDDQDIAVVTPASKPIQFISGTNINNGKPVDVSVGATVSLDGYLVSDDTGVSVVSPDGKTRTAVIDHAVANAFDDGAGGIIFQDLLPGYDSATSDVPYDADLSKIMILNAGAAKPTVFVTAPNATTGVKLWDVGKFQGKVSMLYEKVLRTHPADPDTSPIRELDLRDLGTNSDRQLDLSTDTDSQPSTGIAGPGDEIYAATIGPNQIGIDWGPADTSWIWFNSDLQVDESLHTNCDMLNRSASLWNCFVSAGQMVGDKMMLAPHSDHKGNIVGVDEIDIATGAVLHSASTYVDSPTVGSESIGQISLSARGNQSLLSFTAESGTSNLPAFLIDMTTWKATPVDLAGPARFISSPIVRPVQSGPSSSTTTSRAVTTSTEPPTTGSPNTPRQRIEAGTPVVVSDYTAPIFDGSNINNIGFSSPDGNVECSSIEAMPDGTSGYPELDCVIDNYTFPDTPTPASCQDLPISWISNIISLSRDGPVQGACTGGSPIGGNTPTLPYGSTIQFGSFSCLMAQDGLLCLNQSDQGWLVSTSSYQEIG